MSTPPAPPPVNNPTRKCITPNASTSPIMRTKIGSYVERFEVVELAIQETMPAAPMSISDCYLIENEGEHEHERDRDENSYHRFSPERENPRPNYGIHSHILFLMNAYRESITNPVRNPRHHAMSGKKIKSEKIIYHRVIQRRLPNIRDIASWFLHDRERLAYTLSRREGKYRTGEMHSEPRRRSLSAISLYHSSSLSLACSWKPSTL